MRLPLRLRHQLKRWSRLGLLGLTLLFLLVACSASVNPEPDEGQDGDVPPAEPIVEVPLRIDLPGAAENTLVLLGDTGFQEVAPQEGTATFDTPNKPTKYEVYTQEGELLAMGFYLPLYPDEANSGSLIVSPTSTALVLVLEDMPARYLAEYGLIRIRDAVQTHAQFSDLVSGIERALANDVSWLDDDSIFDLATTILFDTQSQLPLEAEALGSLQTPPVRWPISVPLTNGGLGLYNYHDRLSFNEFYSLPAGVTSQPLTDTYRYTNDTSRVFLNLSSDTSWDKTTAWSGMFAGVADLESSELPEVLANDSKMRRYGLDSFDMFDAAITLAYDEVACYFDPDRAECANLASFTSRFAGQMSYPIQGFAELSANYKVCSSNYSYIEHAFFMDQRSEFAALVEDDYLVADALKKAALADLFNFFELMLGALPNSGRGNAPDYSVTELIGDILTSSSADYAAFRALLVSLPTLDSKTIAEAFTNFSAAFQSEGQKANSLARRLAKVWHGNATKTATGAVQQRVKKFGKKAATKLLKVTRITDVGFGALTLGSYIENMVSMRKFGDRTLYKNVNRCYLIRVDSGTATVDLISTLRGTVQFPPGTLAEAVEELAVTLISEDDQMLQAELLGVNEGADGLEVDFYFPAVQRQRYTVQASATLTTESAQQNLTSVERTQAFTSRSLSDDVILDRKIILSAAAPAQVRWTYNNSSELTPFTPQNPVEGLQWVPTEITTTIPDPWFEITDSFASYNRYANTDWTLSALITNRGNAPHCSFTFLDPSSNAGLALYAAGNTEKGQLDDGCLRPGETGIMAGGIDDENFDPAEGVTLSLIGESGSPSPPTPGRVIVEGWKQISVATGVGDLPAVEYVVANEGEETIIFENALLVHLDSSNAFKAFSFLSPNVTPSSEITNPSPDIAPGESKSFVGIDISRALVDESAEFPTSQKVVAFTHYVLANPK